MELIPSILISHANKAQYVEDTVEQPWIDWVPIAISALAFLVSIVFGVSSGRTARRALRITEREEARRSPRLSLYVHDTALWKSPHNATRAYGVHLQLVNPTDLPTTVVMAELHITYSVDAHLAVVKTPIVEPTTFRCSFKKIEIPQRLEANGVASGWLVFRVADALVDRGDVHRYDVVVRDVHNVVETRQIAVFRERTST